MSNRIKAKHKIDRRLGVNLWGRQKSPINNQRTHPPGQHGQRRKKPTDYGIQLMAKQKLKGYYGNIGEKQFLRYYKEAVRRKGDTGEILIGLLETRLDAVIYRMKIASTVFAARQYVSHGHIKVNGVRVTIPSYLVQPDDEIELSSKMKENEQILLAFGSIERDIPEYVSFDTNSLKGKYIRVPSLDEVPYPVQMEPNLVIEFYSR